jgi:hypothetical protein
MPKSKSNKRRNSNNFVGIALLAIIVLAVGLLTFADANPNLLLSFQHGGVKGANIVLPTLEPTEIPTDTPTPIPQVYQPPVDPPVLCNIDAKCGGGTTPLKQSECNNSTCCQIGNKWIFYKNKSQCIQDQNAYNGNNTNNSKSGLILCVKSFGSFWDTQSDCDSTPNTAPAQPNSQSNTPVPTTAPQPTQQPQPVDATAYNNCVSNVQNTYNQQQQGCMAQYGGQGTGQACIQIAQQNEQQALNSCNSYPH